jgi:hypothetical protein
MSDGILIRANAIRHVKERKSFHGDASRGLGGTRIYCVWPLGEFERFYYTCAG